MLWECKFSRQRQESFCFLEHDALYIGTYVLMFWRELSQSSFYFPEDRGNGFLQNSGINSTSYKQQTKINSFTQT
jgi:hypothetical protein